MENVSTLDYLLQIETKAAAMVNDAQTEADRRMHESGAKNHAAYEERYKAEVQRLDKLFRENKENTKKQYLQTLEEYRNKISSIDVNVERFSALLNEYLDARGS